VGRQPVGPDQGSSLRRPAAPAAAAHPGHRGCSSAGPSAQAGCGPLQLARASGSSSSEPVRTLFPAAWATGQRSGDPRRLLIGNGPTNQLTRQGQPVLVSSHQAAAGNRFTPLLAVAVFCGKTRLPRKLGGQGPLANDSLRGWIHPPSTMLRPAWARTSRRLCPVGGGRSGALFGTVTQGHVEGAVGRSGVFHEIQPLTGD